MRFSAFDREFRYESKCVSSLVADFADKYVEIAEKRRTVFFMYGVKTSAILALPSITSVFDTEIAEIAHPAPIT